MSTKIINRRLLGLAEVCALLSAY